MTFSCTCSRIESWLPIRSSREPRPCASFFAALCNDRRGWSKFPFRRHRESYRVCSVPNKSRASSTVRNAVIRRSPITRAATGIARSAKRQHASGGWLFRRRQLQFHGALRHWSEAKLFRRFLRSWFQSDWVAYAKKPFGGPEHVLHYLARYTASGGDFQSPAVIVCRRTSELSLAGLRARQSAAQNDPHDRGVPTPLSTACAAAWLCADSALRIPGPSPTRTTHHPVPPVISESNSVTLFRSLASTTRLGRPVLSRMCRGDGNPGTPHGSADCLPVRQSAEFP